MKRYPWLRKPFLAVAVAVVVELTLAGASQAATLPDLEADSLGGTHVVLPRDANGKRLVLLLAFTKESEGDVKSWSRKLLDNRIAGKDAVYVVVVADKTIFFGHSKVRKTVEQSTVGTKEQLNNNVLITFDGTGWRDLVPPGDKKTAGIVVCDASGSIVYAKREPFDDATLAEVEKAAN